MTAALAALAMITVACGLIAWVWLADWRWAATGAAAWLVFARKGPR
jgi:hypothetical protein